MNYANVFGRTQKQFDMTMNREKITVADFFNFDIKYDVFFRRNQRSTTPQGKVIVPDVYSALVREKITGKCKVAQFLVNLGELHGKVGETLTMPKWGYIGDAKDWDINTPMDVTQMKQTSTTATIKAIQAPAVKVADYDSEVELGNAINEAAEQQAIAVGRKYDTDAIAEALNSPLKYNPYTQAYREERERAEAEAEILTMFGEEIDVELLIDWDTVEENAYEYAEELAQAWLDGSEWVPEEIMDWAWYDLSDHNM